MGEKKVIDRFERPALLAGIFAVLFFLRGGTVIVTILSFFLFILIFAVIDEIWDKIKPKKENEAKK